MDDENVFQGMPCPICDLDELDEDGCCSVCSYDALEDSEDAE